MKGNRQKNVWGQMFGTFTLGAVLGSLISLLYAPASGRVIRKRIGMKFRVLGQSTAKQIKQTKKLLAKKASLLREATTEKLGHTRDWLVERVSNGNGRRPHSRRIVRHV